MSQIKFGVGDKVRHRSDDQAPEMIVIRFKDGYYYCNYWDSHENRFRIEQTFVEVELALIRKYEP
jgi:uncharacterized protein YodC (DUF2158 family)